MRKTTILVALYELFNQGPVGGFLFGGSSTMVGFERICHPGRTASGANDPDTVRTNPSSGATFLHLRVTDTNTSELKPASILVSDVTGEAFDEARDVAEPVIVPRSLWRRADVLCVVLDAGKMTVPTKRHLARTGARSLLRAAREGQLTTDTCRLAIVTTKWDLVRSADSEAFAIETERQLVDQFGPCFASVSTHRVAARPMAASIPFAFGLPALMTEWLSRGLTKPMVVTASEQVSRLNSFGHWFWEREAKVLAGVFDVI